MARSKARLPKHKRDWNKIRKKAPKVPDITCPAIDDVINRLETLSSTTKLLTPAQYKMLSNKLERLRTANEQLRESGQYWHDACQQVINEHIGNKKKSDFSRW